MMIKPVDMMEKSATLPHTHEAQPQQVNLTIQ